MGVPTNKDKGTLDQ